MHWKMKILREILAGLLEGRDDLIQVRVGGR